ncbi:hypothetical protein A7A09_007910 [Paracoccus methylarcula]|uniref:Uncharacterized protein n=1 Tax=Paracoccus methylarcula TaxID=72022 RepID=A0A422QYE9_9RHOB|nr:hypothetical protein A7A09_007910 [Paracoccus methylarcula]
MADLSQVFRSINIILTEFERNYHAMSCFPVSGTIGNLRQTGAIGQFVTGIAGFSAVTCGCPRMAPCMAG